MEHESINYVEFPAQDLSTTKQFFNQVFNWSFEDYGDEYTAFEAKGLTGGFYLSDKASSTESGAALIVIYSQDLEATQSKIEQAGGVVHVPIFAFPGGRRFHFKEPSGNELAVWSDRE
ncbi:VOC family protein [Vibrio maerlii]|uniref:VOC family protein n=1 Tax=Vibrio maerlii TaxID=2231648 RepID=UPI000E3BC194|nr:VOC family protein [Vibrio maerlii]